MSAYHQNTNIVPLAGQCSLATVLAVTRSTRRLFRSPLRRPVRLACRVYRRAGVVPREPMQAHDSVAIARRDAKMQKALK